MKNKYFYYPFNASPDSPLEFEDKIALWGVLMFVLLLGYWLFM